MLELKCQENARAIAQQIKTSGGSASQDYSTTEHVVGKWIDGTTEVYEKVITAESASTGSSTIAHGITNLGEVVSLSGVCVYSDKYLPLPYVSTTSTYCISIGNVDATNIEIDLGESFSAVSDIVLIIRYTKSVS